MPSLLTGRVLQLGCEAMWRDTRLSVLERGYEIEAQLSASFEQARGNPSALSEWLYSLMSAQEAPVQLAGVRNALFHVLGYFKEHLSPMARHDWSSLIVADPYRAHNRVYQLLSEFPLHELATWYYWRRDSWRIAWIQCDGQWLQFLVRLTGNELDVDMRLGAEVWQSRPVDSAEMRVWLHEQRLALTLPNGEQILHPSCFGFGEKIPEHQG